MTVVLCNARGPERLCPVTRDGPSTDGFPVTLGQMQNYTEEVGRAPEQVDEWVLYCFQGLLNLPHCICLWAISRIAMDRYRRAFTFVTFLLFLGGTTCAASTSLTEWHNGEGKLDGKTVFKRSGSQCAEVLT